MESVEQRRVVVRRIQINGVGLLKDGKGFVYNEKTNKVVGLYVKDDRGESYYKKRLSLRYESKKGQMNINTYVSTLQELFIEYEKEDKKVLLVIYNKALKDISEIESIELGPTVEQYQELIIAVRLVIVLRAILASAPPSIDYTNCAVCKTPDFDSSFKKCGNCKKMYYCSSDCTKVAWAEHKKVCNQLMCCEEWL